jgi:hypothetical protein
VLLPSVSHLNPVLFLSLSLINSSFESIIR